jgi:hypothetical protein
VHVIGKLADVPLIDRRKLHGFRGRHSRLRVAFTARHLHSTPTEFIQRTAHLSFHPA